MDNLDNRIAIISHRGHSLLRHRFAGSRAHAVLAITVCRATGVRH